MVPSAVLALFVACSVVVAVPTTPTEGFSNETVHKIKGNLKQIATHSWEIGTEQEALTELEWPHLSVFGGGIPPPATLEPADSAADVIAIATEVVRNITNSTGPLIDGGGAVGDPASLGVGVLLANWTRTNLSDHSFSVAAQNQLRYLLDEAPRTLDGAISHRAEQVQLWADFVYMAPPFIAYYGALQGGLDGAMLLSEAYLQCKLYRQYLSDESGLWKHIVLGDWQDNHHWGTGNAWAAAGMLRVLETIRHSEHAELLHGERKDLEVWIDEILTKTWDFQHPNGTLFNWIDEDETVTFSDTSSTALLAAVTFRMATLTGDLRHIPAANKAFDFIRSSVTEDGWLLGTVDPLTFNTISKPGEFSPEGQAFTLLLQSAWRDFVATTNGN